MLHANELMVGDYLRVNRDGICIPKGTIVRVSEIDSENTFREKGLKGSARCEAMDDTWLSGGVWCDYLDPIPLTPEILEKNGFVKNEKAKSRKAYTIIDGDVYISWWRNRANIVVSRRHIGLSSNHVNVDAKCVHELQHALRLCGIEKEITLYDMSAPNKIPEGR